MPQSLDAGELATILYSFDKLPNDEKLVKICEHQELYDFYKSPFLQWFTQYANKKQSDMLIHLLNQDNTYTLTLFDSVLNHNNPFSIEYLNSGGLFNILHMDIEYTTYTFLSKLIQKKKFYYHEFKETNTLYMLVRLQESMLYIDALDTDYPDYLALLNKQDMVYEDKFVYTFQFYLTKSVLPNHIKETFPIVLKKKGILWFSSVFNFNRYRKDSLLSDQQCEDIIYLLTTFKKDVKNYLSVNSPFWLTRWKKYIYSLKQSENMFDFLTPEMDTKITKLSFYYYNNHYKSQEEDRNVLRKILGEYSQEYLYAFIFHNGVKFSKKEINQKKPKFIKDQNNPEYGYKTYSYW